MHVLINLSENCIVTAARSHQSPEQTANSTLTEVDTKKKANKKNINGHKLNLNQKRKRGP